MLFNNSSPRGGSLNATDDGFEIARPRHHGRRIIEVAEGRRRAQKVFEERIWRANGRKHHNTTAPETRGSRALSSGRSSVRSQPRLRSTTQTLCHTRTRVLYEENARKESRIGAQMFSRTRSGVTAGGNKRLQYGSAGCGVGKF